MKSKANQMTEQKRQEILPSVLVRIFKVSTQIIVWEVSSDNLQKIL